MPASAQASQAGEPGSISDPAHDPDWTYTGSERDEELLEPQLKYERLGADVQDILERSQATCLCLSDKLVALGTSRGTLHILDYSGNEVQRLEGHQSAISALCFDAESEYLASAAQTASVRVQNLYSEEVQRMEFRAGIKALALDPCFASRKNKEVVTGTRGGVLQISAQGWLGRNDTLLHSGEGPIYEAQWVSNLIIWSNDLGARVYDHTTHRHVGLIERPKGGVFPPAFRCSIFVVDENTLYLGWPNCIKVVKVVDAPVPEQLNGNKKTLNLSFEIPTTHFVLGVVPFGEELAVLIYREAEQEQVPVSTSASAPLGDSVYSTPPATASVPAGGTGTAIGPAAKIVAAAVGAGVLGVAALEAGMVVAGVPDGGVLASTVVGIGPAASGDDKRVGEAVAVGVAAGVDGDGAVGKQAAAGSGGKGEERAGQQGVRSFGGSGRVDGEEFAARSAEQEALCPELRIISKDKSERAVDVLPVNAFQDNEPQDYFLVPSASLRRSGGGRATGRHGSGNQALEDAMYFIVSPKDIVVGKPRGADDRVAWLMQHGKYEAALTIAKAHQTAVPQLYEQVANSYLDHLLTAGDANKAAALCPRLLGSDSKWWERWVYLFAQRRYLPALADFVPTQPPCQLRPTAYEMILNSFLLSPADHPKLLSLVRSWPRGIYHSSTLVEAVSMRMQRLGGASHALWEVLAHLYLQQGRPDLSLAIYLQMHSPVVFEFMRQHHLVHTINGAKAGMLLEINEEEALSFLVQELELIPPGAVVPVLLDTMNQQPQGSKEYRMWRKRLHNYLHRVFVVDHTVAAEYHELQVALYADYDVGKLMQFLVASQYYPLEAALETCQQRGLVAEMVFVLGRMGNTRQALYLIIERLADIPRALEFVKEQQDEELWEDLISWALSSPDTTGALLDHCGGNINPLQLISRIPEGMHIPRLRDRIRSIIADFRTQTTLREGCNVILHSDCMALVSRLFVAIRRAIRVVYIPPGANLQGYSTLTSSPLPNPNPTPELPPSFSSPVGKGKGFSILDSIKGGEGTSAMSEKGLVLSMAALPVLTVVGGGSVGQWQKYDTNTGRLDSVSWEQLPQVVRSGGGGQAAMDFGSPTKRGTAGMDSSVQLLVESQQDALAGSVDAFRMQSEGRQKSSKRSQLVRGKAAAAVAVQQKELLPNLVQ